MKFKSLLLFFALIRESVLSHWTFPNDFKFGVATSAYQVEGGWNADGKGESIMDRLYHEHSEYVDDRANGDIACDSYHKWREDIRMMKKMSVHYYRFSIAWTRLYPYGFTTINTPNPAGVAYYNKLINELKANGIDPLVTIYHWDLPQVLEPLGGVLYEDFENIFASFAREVFRLFGDRVKTWVTINEPYSVCRNFYRAPFRDAPYFPDAIYPYVCARKLLLAHAKTYRLYRREFLAQQKGSLGLSLIAGWEEPANPKKAADVQAADRVRQFTLGLFANPIVFGNWPPVVITRVAQRSKLDGLTQSRLPVLSSEEKNLIRNSYDFIGVNNYYTDFVQDSPEPPAGTPKFLNDLRVKFVSPAGTPAVGSLSWGLRKLLNWIRNHYKNPIILITECGFFDKTGTLRDFNRIQFLRQYLNATAQSIHLDKVRVKAFTVWSLMDNLEWTRGFNAKYGLWKVNFKDPNRTRTEKESGKYYGNCIRSKTVL